jgi:hypothetical protein
LATAPLLTATPSGDLLELRPSGSWTAANVATLETLSDTVTAQLDRSETIRVDMTEVRELDTLGQIRSSASLQDNRLILAQSTRSPHSMKGWRRSRPKRRYPTETAKNYHR